MPRYSPNKTKPSTSSHIQILQALSSRRWMTSGRRVQDRSKYKRVQELEIAKEKHKIASKILTLFEILKAEPESIITLRNLDHHRKKINLPKPHKISDFLHKSPKLFELYKDPRGVVWCGMTEKAEALVREEEELIEKNSDKAVEYVSRMLMMSVDKRLRINKIAHFRRDFGLPVDFRNRWVHEHPENFRVVAPFKPHDEEEYLELVSWKPRWAITELEKKVSGIKECTDYDENHVPGLLSLPFPLKFPENYKKVYRFGGKLDHFQKREYLSPYADARGSEPGSQEFDKRAVAVMHELLSFTIEKRLVTDYLTHFRREFVMPQKLMRLLLKHFGIFYVSERGKRFSVFLKEAYDGSELIEKHPLVVWKEKVLSHVGYRGKDKRIRSFLDAYENESEDEAVGDFKDESMDDSDDFDADGSEMEVDEVCKAYND